MSGGRPSWVRVRKAAVWGPEGGATRLRPPIVQAKVRSRVILREGQTFTPGYERVRICGTGGRV